MCLCAAMELTRASPSWLNSIAASTDNSDDSAVELSTRATTPDGSPLFLSSNTGPSFEAKFLSLCDVASSDAPVSRTESRTVLAVEEPSSDIVKTICCVAAGYVGECISLRHSRLAHGWRCSYQLEL